MRVVIVDGNKISDWEALHKFLAWELRFPLWYGNNLDALYDCLTDLSEPTAIQVVNSDALRAHLGLASHGFFRVLQDLGLSVTAESN
jgi:ribonuclease inhibitor